MATGQNRKRNSKRRRTDFRALWGGLFRRNEVQGDDVTHGTLYDTEGEDAEDKGERAVSRLRRIWAHIGVWKLVAAIVFFLFICPLTCVTVRMWQPQDISDIEGYNDNIPSRNLTRLICNKTAAGEPIIIREDDVNRYLRDTCCIKQDGFFSIFAEARGMAFRFHEGYAEFIIERAFGPLTRQTTTVNITCYIETVNGQPELKAELHGGEPVFGSVPRGGSIGKVAIPQRHIVILQPALESLRDCYPEIRDALKQHLYCPVFKEGRVELHPYQYQQANTN